MELNISIMNRLYRYILAVAAIAAAASCAKNIAPENPAADTEVLPENFELMEFATSVDDPMSTPENQPAASVTTKTTYQSRKVYWEETDKISVFSIGETETVRTEFGVKTLSDDRMTATFQGLADSHASVFCAVYPHNDKNAYENGTLTVNIPSEQTAVAEGFASGANVSVAYSANNGEVSLKFLNVTTLLCIKFADANDAANTQSITFRAKKNETEYWGLSGQAQLTLGAENVPVVSEGDEQQVTLLAPADGFVKDAIYYVPVYAVGECAGFEVTFTDLNGDPYTKTKNVPGSLDRNWLFNFSSIPGPYDTLPKEFTIEWDFNNKNWPFSGVCKYESSKGETYAYTYTYEFNGTPMSADWNLKMGYKSYELTDTGLSNTEANSFIMQLPAVKNRYMTRIVVLLASNSQNTRPALQTKWDNVGDGAYCLLAGKYLKKETECVVDFYSDIIVFNGKFMSSTTSTTQSAESYSFKTSERPNFTPALGKQYYLKLRDKGVISKITLTYSINAPGEAPAE